MFEIGWAELLVIGVVALIVIGPEDLPEMFRQIGRFTAKLRQMGREFQKAMDQAAKETGVKDVARDIGAMTSPKAMGLDAVKAAADKFEKWDPIKNAAKPTATRTPGPSAAGEAAADAAADAVLEARTATALSGLTATAAPAAAAPATAAPTTAAAQAAGSEPGPAMGPATRALYDKQAARQKVLQESAAKLRAIDAAPAQSPSASPSPASEPAPAASAASTPAPAARSRAASARNAAEPAETAAKKPRKTRTAKGSEA